MSIDLSTYQSIQSNLFVRIDVQEYRTTTSGSYTSTILRFSDRLGTVSIYGENYTGLGNLMSISQSSSEIRVSGGELTIVLSGIPNTSIAEIVNSKIKGSPVVITRAIFNAANGTLLSIAGNPLGRFKGFVNNYSLTEEYDSETRTSSNTLVLTCSSNIDILENKVAGRKTNPKSQKAFYPSDLSMDRVPTLKGATFDFGAPQ
jgi:hypothetical protein